MSYCNICKVQLDQPGLIETADCGGDCLECMGRAGDPAAAECFLKEIHALRAALYAALHEPEPDVEYLCPKCGSSNVLQDAYVNMNTGEEQVFDQKTCADCGAEFDVAVEVPIEKEN
jgi:hypothetical protein